MKHFRISAVAAALTLYVPAGYGADGTAMVEIPFPTRTSAWISGLKCKDLLGDTEGSVNQDNFPAFSFWLHGYITGLASALPFDAMPKVNIFDWVALTKFDAMVLASCTRKRDTSAVETAVDAAAFLLSPTSKKKTPLRGVDGKRE